MTSDKDLQHLRKRIDQIDRNLVRLLDERLTVVQGIGNVKEQRRLSLHDQARENEIFKNLRSHARHPELRAAISHIYEPILELSKVVQTTRRLDMHQPQTAGVTIGIIGYGRFGALMVDVLQNHWPRAVVKVVSRSHAPDSRLFFSFAEVAQCEIIIPCMPISALPEVLRELKPLLKAGSTIIDICSVKVLPARWMAEIIGDKAGLIATHPMFGPDSTHHGTHWNGLTMVLHNISATRRLYESYMAFWQSLGVTTIELTPDEHDRYAAYTINYSHLIGRVGEFLDIHPTPIDTKAFEELYNSMQYVIHDSWDLFRDMQKYNPYALEMLRRTLRALEMIQDKLTGKDQPVIHSRPTPAPGENSEPKRVSIQGYAGSYHDMVARNVFGETVITLQRDSFDEVFADVIAGEAEFGVVAIENSIVGSLEENYDLLLENNVSIVGERYLRISHQLMVLPGTNLEDITEVLSHPMALKQCQPFLARHHNWIITEYPDTAGSAAFIKREHKVRAAAIASPLAAEIYGMKIVAHDIETNKRSYTRFFIIAREPNYPPDANKTSIVLTLKHEAGSLYRVLDVLHRHNINMTKIESRPIAGVEWQYRFYIDFEGGVQEEKVKTALDAIQKFSDWIKILGSYVSQPIIE